MAQQPSITNVFLYKLSRMCLLIKTSLLLFFLKYCSSKVIPIIYEEYEECVKPEEKAGKFDFSELEIIAESDTHVYMNGSWNFIEEVKSPWTAIIFMERYERSQWILEALYKKVPDFCKSIQDPEETWYHVTSHFEPKNCPFPAGVRFSIM